MTQKEHDMLLPGGSKVEALDMSEFAPASASRRRARLGLVLLGIAAVAACLVFASRVGGSQGVELESVVAQEEALADDDKLPSWLRTAPVQLRPLKTLIHEQETDRQMAQGVMADRKRKRQEEREHEASPRELAMRSVHALAARKSRSHAVHELEPVRFQQASSVPSSERKERDMEAAAKPEEKGSGNPKSDATTEEARPAEQEARKAAVEPAQEMSIPAEIRDEQAKIAEVKSGEHSAEEDARKVEGQKISEIKAIADKTIGLLQGGITKLKAEELEQSEKKQIKAQIAQVEEQEANKLAALNNKLASLPETAANEIKEDKKESDEEQEGGGQTKSDIEKKHDEEAEEKRAQYQEENKKEAKDIASAKGKCDDQDCDVDKEDNKWLAHKGSVDRYAQLALLGSGDAKQRAMEHMRRLQKQIMSDFKHVTSFATAQKRIIEPQAAADQAPKPATL